jgi:putative Mn2+ efflux pump MntP
VTRRQVFRLAFHFGLFQFIMPILGWFLGTSVEGIIGRYDLWIAFGLLSFIGAKMLRESICMDKTETKSDPTRGWSLVMLSLATSLDALAVGLSMALLGESIWFPALVIGLMAAALTTVGITSASRLGERWACWAGVGGGCLLLGIGLQILVSHLAA